MRLQYGVFVIILASIMLSSFANATSIIPVPAIGPGETGIVTNLSATLLKPSGEWNGVFVDVDREPAEVVTAYRTSKIEKYRSQA